MFKPVSANPPAQSAAKPRLALRLLAGSLLFGLWVLLSGKFDAFHLGVGLISVFGVLWMHAYLPPIESSSTPLLKPFNCLLYFFWLLWEMLQSAFAVSRIILGSSANLASPKLIAFESKQPSLVQGVILANSITLTPGTLTVDYRDDRYLIHALNDNTAADLLGGEMAKRVRNLTGKSDGDALLQLSPEDWRILR